jgi:hypothetical protein
MSETLLPTARTLIDVDAYVGAAVRAWKANERGTPSRESIGVLWAQYALETGGGTHCYNHNLGNVKHVAGDGFDYCALKGVWEGMRAELFATLLHPPLGHLIRLDPSVDHQKAVGPGKLAVLFDPPHPATLFRAYPTLAAAMIEHLRFLKGKRYAPAWPAVEQGNVALFAAELHKAGYYTASVNAYAAGMLRWFLTYEACGAYERALEAVAVEDADTVVFVPEAACEMPADRKITPFPVEPTTNDDNVMVSDLLEVHESGCASWDNAACDCAIAGVKKDA